MNPSLQRLLQRPDLWRSRDYRSSGGIATGFRELDRALYGGWPRAALTELLLDRPGIGELELLLPALSALSREQLSQVWINPPFVPYAPALARAGIGPESLLIVRTEPKQQLWACEQALRCAAVGAVLYWPSQPLRYAELRKLQVAAGAQQSFAFLFRGTGNAAHTSPAALRLQLGVADRQLSVQILKQRGGIAGQQVQLPRSLVFDAQMPLSECATLVGAHLTAEEDAFDAIATPRRLIEPIANRRPLPRRFSVRTERHATH
ncbi:MAG: cell division inhibitor SulA [Verrucomicrobiaceae bacterium]|nr:cell division inhibitor SulA [Verrucomicrobiaceae bacterium]